MLINKMKFLNKDNADFFWNAKIQL